MPTASTALLDNHPDPAFRVWMARHMPAERVAAVTAYLASAGAELNGEILTAAGGRVSRMVFFESHGIVDAALTPESVGERIREICDLSGGAARVFQSDHMAACTDAFQDAPSQGGGGAANPTESAFE
jgi:hypothetical protein